MRGIVRILSNDYTSSVPGSGIKIKGGPARFAADFSEVAIAQGHEWVGLVHDLKAKESGERIAAENGKVFVLVAAPSATHEMLREVRAHATPDDFFRAEIEAVSGILREHAPDIVFINGFSAFAWVLSAAAGRVGVPFVIQHAGIWHREIDEYAELFTPEGRDLCYLMEQDGAERAFMNIFLNTYSRQAFEELVQPKAGYHAQVIPHPMPDWPFEGDFRPSHTPPHIGVVARWDRIKNHEAILALAEEIQRQRLSWRISCVTSIPETPARADFKKRYRELITIIPNMDREALREFYASVDLMILPSHFDVSPTVVMEAISVGVPTLISPHVGWVSEYAESGMGEWVIDFSAPAQVVRRIGELLARGEWSEARTFAEYVKKWHNPDTIYSSYLALFDSARANR